jgi:hypothetical protein
MGLIFCPISLILITHLETNAFQMKSEEMEVLELISPTFNRRISANILAPRKSLTFTASTKKLRAKLTYKKKAGRKMLVKLTFDDNKKDE